jgi:hypothetical protein
MAKADPAQIDWAARAAKRRNDGFLDICLSPLFNIPSSTYEVLSLPGPKWLWEQHVAESWPKKFFHFEGVERASALHDRARSYSVALNDMPGMNGFFDLLTVRSLKSALKTTKKQYDIIYADYMGAWGMDKLDDVEIICKRGLLKTFGCLVLTLSLVRNASPLFSEVQAYARGDFECAIIDDREHLRALGLLPPSSVSSMSQGIPHMVTATAASHSMRLEPVAGHVYYNAYEHEGGLRLAPELSLVFRNTPKRRR